MSDHVAAKAGLATSDRAHLEGLNLVGMNRRGFDKKQSLEANKVIKQIFDDNSKNVFTKRKNYMSCQKH